MNSQDHIICRDINCVSLFHPFCFDDKIELDGPNGSEVWVVKNMGCGWQLRALADTRLHPTIHDIFGMDDFIAAILTHSKT